MPSSTARRMMDLFAGLLEAHGTHGMPVRDGPKWVIKPSAKTVREPVTLALWEAHLAGTRPLGVVPIRADSQCIWGSIDVDNYNISAAELVGAVSRAKLPLVACRSKSGGVHLFLFLADPAPAQKVQAALRSMAATLGLNGCEIFPKQVQLLVDRGDTGGWMCMPYLGTTFDGRLHEQAGVKHTGSAMTVEEFLDAAEAARRPPSWLEEVLGRRSPAQPGVRFGDGPPCLQYLAQEGFPDGGRNSSLAHMATYLKRKFPSTWKTELENANRELMVPPLDASEVETVQRSYGRRDYNYKCHDEPMASHCDAHLCRTREFGVGEGIGRYPDLGSLTIMDSNPAVFFIDVGGGRRVGVNEDEIFDYQLFCKRVWKQTLDTAFDPLKTQKWRQMLNEAADRAERVSAPEDQTDVGRLRRSLGVLLTDRTRGRERESLLGYRPWLDEEQGRYYFFMDKLRLHLKQEGSELADHKEWQLSLLVQKLGGGSARVKVQHTTRACWWVPAGSIDQVPEQPVPKPKGPGI